MTYAESPRSPVYTVVPPPRTPQAYMTNSNPNSAAKKGLDYWSKSEDKKSGITCYYSRHSDIRIPRGKPDKPGRPQFSPPGSPRYAPFPNNSPAEQVMSPPASIYQNVPAMPRAKLNGGGANGASGNVVWGGKRNENQDKDWNNEPSSNTPLTAYGNMHNNNNNNNNNGEATSSENGKKRGSGRRKPKWGRCIQTLFCCVAPPREIEKIQSSNNRTSNNNLSNGRTTPINGISAGNGTGNGLAATSNNSSQQIQLITQVNRDGTVTGLPGGTQILQNQNGSGDGGAQNGAQQNAQFYERSELNSNEKPLLGPLLPIDSKKKCLVIDLDETLVHSSFKPVKNPDFVIPVEIDGVEHQVYVLKRPYVDEFLARVGEMFECVLFTASLAKYADPVADLLDKKGVFRARLFREACVFHKGNFVKDLSRLGRLLERTLIIDNSPASYAFHPENAVPVQTWFDDPADTELLDILCHLEHLNQYESVYDSLRPEEGPPSGDLALLD
ncbi:unnamed protein product [Caenorhabditis angaria]|uniref:protein-serine/threonine phosphatase n=1 Tax=Caenorhabditis angaria TaxID=860376 RepID=A0A9P1I9I9_9PELO|nr:unnamed protein product [Caenorhabditis angaria]